MVIVIVSNIPSYQLGPFLLLFLSVTDAEIGLNIILIAGYISRPRSDTVDIYTNIQYAYIGQVNNRQMHRSVFVETKEHDSNDRRTKLP